MDLTPHRQRVAHALNAMEKATERLVNALAHQPVWIVVDGATTQANATRLACNAYATIDFGMEYAP